MRNAIENTGFTPPAFHELGNERHTAAFAELIATIALAISTIVAATVVSIGIAHAEVGDTIIEHQGGVFAVALILGLLFVGLGGASVFSSGDKSKH